MASTSEIDRIITIGTRAAGGVGVIGAFAADAPILAGIWGTMIYRIAKENYVGFDSETCVKVATSVIASAASFMGGAALLSKILTYSGVGLVLGVGINCAVNYFYTWRLGIAFDEIFDDYGTDTAISKLAWIAVQRLMPWPSWSEVREFYNFITD